MGTVSRYMTSEDPGLGPKGAPARSSVPVRLHITKREGRPLTRNQSAFNRLVARIEQLRKAIGQRHAELDAHLAFYVAELHPIELRVHAREVELILALHPYLKRPDFRGKRQRASLREVLFILLDRVAEGSPAMANPDLDRIHDELMASEPGSRGGEPTPAEVEDMKAAIEEIAAATHIDLKAEGIDPTLPGPELRRRIEALMEKLIRFGPESVHRTADVGEGDPDGSGRAGWGAGEVPPKGEGQKQSRKARAHEERERAAAELKDRDLGQLYKQLAKLLHPDLESDPDRRREKEEAMKRLTVAREAGDLHTLLQLELEWMRREQAEVGRIADDRLRIYNQVLREQVAEMERQLDKAVDHPRYAPLHLLSPGFGLSGVFDRDAARAKLEETLQALEETLEGLSGAGDAKIVKAIVQEYSAALRPGKGWDLFGF